MGGQGGCIGGKQRCGLAQGGRGTGGFVGCTLPPGQAHLSASAGQPGPPEPLLLALPLPLARPPPALVLARAVHEDVLLQLEDEEVAWRSRS